MGPQLRLPWSRNFNPSGKTWVKYCRSNYTNFCWSLNEEAHINNNPNEEVVSVRRRVIILHTYCKLYSNKHFLASPSKYALTLKIQHAVRDKHATTKYERFSLKFHVVLDFLIKILADLKCCCGNVCYILRVKSDKLMCPSCDPENCPFVIRHVVTTDM